MQLRSSSIFYIYFIALAVLTWTSSVHGAAINRNSSPSRRDLVEGATNFGIDIWDDDVLKRDDTASTKSTNGPHGSIEEQNTLAERAAVENNGVENDNLKNSRRWYTLVEIAENKESE